ncbi:MULTISPECIES: LysR family transcriptional regulator [Pigmentiphaga]|uniref:LysR family transcriptional regulator n=1 Tax=Pigmentiphaga daeguensis TaxID=414049 RepID=A0ABN1C4V1_9BURK|nr:MULTISPECIES: LysR family transcriptional regulator [unclassified Pigmentiphaga]OVZ65486.1 LysR family transcriptional regulator [Pigmentiphaga sp. NML030171]
MNFRQLDLNLLRVLVSIHQTRSVTAAGKLLSLSQPATSNALARLRYFFDDELFVRTPQGLVPTRICEQVAPTVAAELRALETAVTGREAFDPQHSHVEWRVSMSDLGEMTFLPTLAAALHTEAPHSRLTNISVPANDVAAALEAREIDFCLGILHPKQRGIQADVLFHEPYVAITSPDWTPTPGHKGKTLSPAELASASLLVASPTATFHDSVSEMLTRMKLDDRIAVRARHFGALPEMVMNSRMLAIVPTTYARNAQPRYGFKVWTLPYAPAYDVRLLWHASTARDPSLQWVRALVHRLFRVPAAGEDGAAPAKRARRRAAPQ